MKPPPVLRRLTALALGLVLLAAPALATWSIVVVDTRTGEVCVASATCLANLNLKLFLPVIVPGVGAGASQAQLDITGASRVIMWDGLHNGLTPDEILTILSTKSGFQQRQYGIAAMNGAPVTFTGNFAGIAKLGVTGIVGDLRYAIQGNVLAGQEIVTGAELALLTTPGDLGQKVMAAMEAARALGGDGRCSCSASDPTGCGVPPPTPFKSAHTAFIVLARVGDTEGVCNGSIGCANGNGYYLELKEWGDVGDPDPVRVIETRFRDWRLSKKGKADAIKSEVVPGAEALVADGVDATKVAIRLRDLNGAAIGHGGHVVQLELQPGSAGATQPSAVVDNGDGTYSFVLGAGTQTGTDIWRIRVSGDNARATLHPDLKIRVDPAKPLHSGWSSLSAAQGASVPLVINMGSGAKLRNYLVLGSASGTQPGMPFAGTTLPLNRDRFLRFTFTHANGPLLASTFGLLDSTGRASASFEALPGLLLPYVGHHIDWSAVIFDPTKSTATPPVGFDVLP